MGKVKKILCVCQAGLGSSLILGMNVEKVLEAMGKGDIKVEHTSIGDTTAGQADLYIAGGDIYEQVKVFGPCVAVHNLVNKNEIREVLEKYFEENPDEE